MALAERIKVSKLVPKPHIIPPMVLANYLRQNDEWKTSSGGVKAKEIVIKSVNIVLKI